jgi:hypothetical protein
LQDIVNRKQISESIKNHLSEHDYQKAAKMWDFLTTDEDIQNSIRAGNRLAVNYLGYTDHGLDHVTIVSQNVLDILEASKEGIIPAFIQQGLGDYDDVAVICLAACYLHDVGHIIHRTEHELVSSIMAKELLIEQLHSLYSDHKKCIEVLSHIQHAIYGHDEKIQCLTPEAGFVTIADGLDMCEGRSRKPYDMGKVDIHSLSALSITNVEISKGSRRRPIQITIMMAASAGVFQVEEIFLPKLRSSGLEDETEIITLVNNEPLALSQVIKLQEEDEDN